MWLTNRYPTPTLTLPLKGRETAKFLPLQGGEPALSEVEGSGGGWGKYLHHPLKKLLLFPDLHFNMERPNGKLGNT